jgi:hypothetical protein
MTEQVIVPNQAGEAVGNPIPTAVQKEPVTETVQRKLLLEGIEVYADIISQYKEQIRELVQAGFISEQTASHLVLESEQSFFKQLVKVKYT